MLLPLGRLSGVVLGEVLPFQLVVLPESPALLPVLRSSACPHCSAVACPKGNPRPLSCGGLMPRVCRARTASLGASMELGNALTVLLEQTAC